MKTCLRKETKAGRQLGVGLWLDRGVSQCAQGPEFQTQHYVSWATWYRPVIPACKTLRQEDWEKTVKRSDRHRVSLK